MEYSKWKAALSSRDSKILIDVASFVSPSPQTNPNWAPEVKDAISESRKSSTVDPRTGTLFSPMKSLQDTGKEEKTNDNLTNQNPQIPAKASWVPGRITTNGGSDGLERINLYELPILPLNQNPGDHIVQVGLIRDYRHGASLENPSAPRQSTIIVDAVNFLENFKHKLVNLIAKI